MTTPDKTMEKRFVEAGANLEHDRWARWQKHMFSKCNNRVDGDKVIPAELVERWQRQIDTPYSELSEQEKESDRKETREYLPLVNTELSLQRNRIIEECEKIEAHWEANNPRHEWASKGFEKALQQIIDKIKSIP